jgi:hypothetical protein
MNRWSKMRLLNATKRDIAINYLNKGKHLAVGIETIFVIDRMRSIKNRDLIGLTCDAVPDI